MSRNPSSVRQAAAGAQLSIAIGHHSMDRLLEATRRVEQSHFWWIGFRRFFEPLIATATRAVQDPFILDCGCGTGANLRLLGSYGKAFGFDISPTGLEYAREYGASRVVNGLPPSGVR